MKKLVLLLGIIILLANVSFSQEDKTVTLTVSGQGKTQDEAKQNALRNAIEQAFGTFISSNTEILNDELVKDEIVSVSNGNIQMFEILSEVQIENGEWSTTLKSVVSVTKLTSFCESKGISVEFKGSLFAFNVNQQILNEKNEIKAIEDVCQVIRNIADVSFDYSITASDPISLDASNSKWRIPMYISVYKNSNFDNIPKILYSTLKGISLSLEEAKNYVQLGKNVYPISIASNENDYSYILLRTDASISRLTEMLYYFNHSLQNFNISDGIAEWSIKDKPENLKYIYDYGFRLFIKKINNGVDNGAYCKASVFYTHCSPRFNCNVGMVKELEEVNRGNCGFNPGTNPVLDYKNWGTTGRYGTSNVELNSRKEHYFTNQFSFVKNLQNEMLNNVSGLVISFIPFYNNTPISKDKEYQELASSIEVEEGLVLKVNGLRYKYSAEQLKEIFISIVENPDMTLEKWLSQQYFTLSSKSMDDLTRRYNEFNSIYKTNFKKYKVMKNKELEENSKEIVRYYYDDIKTLEEINKISEYKVLPIKN